MVILRNYLPEDRERKRWEENLGLDMRGQEIESHRELRGGPGVRADISGPGSWTG